MNLNILDLINGISCFQLATFSFFLIHKGRKNISNIILSAFFIVQFIVIFNFLLNDIFANNLKIYGQIVYLFHPFEFLWGPLMFFYVKSQVKSPFRFSYKALIHLLPFIILSILVISKYYILSNEMKYTILRKHTLDDWFYYLNTPFYILLFAYNFSALYLLINYQRSLKEYCSFDVKQNLIWLKIVLYGYIGICIFNVMIIFLHQYFSNSPEVLMITLFAPYLIFFNILFYKALIHPYIIIQPHELPKSQTLILNDQEIQNCSKIIEEYIFTQQLYLNPALTLKDMSETIGIAERNISYTINRNYNQNFFMFINSYRVEEAKRLLTGFDKTKTTMQGVAFDAGFNSRSAFYEAFKKHTGMTPTEYRNKL